MVSTATVGAAPSNGPDPGTFAALGMLINELARASSRADVFAAVSTLLPDVVPLDRASLAFFDADSHAVEIVMLRGAEVEDDIIAKTDDLALTKVVREGESWSSLVTPESVYSDHRTLAEQGFTAILNVPLMRQREAYGTINVGKKEAGAYEESDLRLLAQVGDLVTVALDRIDLQTTTLEHASVAESYASRLETLYDISQELASATTEEKVYRVLSDAAERIVPHDRLSFARVEPNGMDLQITEITTDGEFTQAEPTIMPMSTTTVGRSIIRGRPLYTPDMTQRGGEDALMLSMNGINTGFCIPVRMGGKITGSLNFGAKVQNAFSKQDRDLLTMFARLMSSTLERVKGAALLDHRARHDDLTELPNRREFHSLMERAVQELGQFGTTSVLVIDIDHFTAVNDSMGHAAGDALLVELATHLRAGVKDTDVFARLSGDEFAVLLQTDNPQDANGVAERLRERAENLIFESGGRRFPVTVSIGIVELTAAGALAAMRDADAACNQAKRDGRNRVVSTLSDADALVGYHEGDWVTRIDHALRTDGFELYAQPIKRLALDGDPTEQWAYEVLIRMRSDDGVLIPPGVFIPVAEHYGLIRRIDEWVLQHTLEWLSSDFVPPMGMCTINVSAHSLESKTFLQNVLDKMDATTVDAKRICFEITETAAVRYVDRALDFISALSDRGCTFALDDFGSGFSSFATLKRLPVDFIKIDGSLVIDICTEAVNDAAVRAIQALADALGIVTIAEFVEDDASRVRLTEIGVTYGQGYGLGRPQPLVLLTPDAAA